MSINEVRWLSECGSTNAYAKEHFEEFGPVGAVYTTNQTAGRGRLGRSWVNAEGRALYYTAVIREALAQPATLPLLASLAVRDQLAQRYGVDCQIKWPNDLLLNGRKIVGILCESVSYGYQMQGRGIVCGIGINLAQPQSYFDAANLPNGTSLELQGAKVDLAADPQWLAEALTDFGFDRPLYTFAREGFAPFRDEYKAACVTWAATSPSICRAAAQAAAQPSTWTPTASSSSAPTAARRRSSPAKSPSAASTGPYKFSSIPAPLQAVRPRGRFSFLPAKFVENSGFPTVFHTWFLPGSVCGKLGCQKFQRGEALLPQVRNAAENKFLTSTFFSKKGSSTPFLSRFSLFSRFGIHRV